MRIVLVSKFLASLMVASLLMTVISLSFIWANQVQILAVAEFAEPDWASAKTTLMFFEVCALMALYLTYRLQFNQSNGLVVLSPKFIAPSAYNRWSRTTWGKVLGFAGGNLPQDLSPAQLEAINSLVEAKFALLENLWSPAPQQMVDTARLAVANTLVLTRAEVDAGFIPADDAV